MAAIITGVPTADNAAVAQSWPPVLGSCTMAITVSELTELPHLALDLVAGAAGAETPVRWAHVSEVEDPTPWLEGGELLLTTGIGLPSGAGDQEAYLRRLHRAHAVGLVIVPDTAPP